MTSPRFAAVIAAIDEINREDPSARTEPYGRRMGAWIDRLSPGASEELRIAARGQHVRRWTIPRGKYPMDRGGYLRWREDLKVFHADLLAGLMRGAGYDDAAVERMRGIILRRNLKANAEAQALEDAACLEFLETDLDEMIAKTPEEKMVDIVKKSWRKMSDAGRAAALRLEFSEAGRALIQKAIPSPTSS